MRRLRNHEYKKELSTRKIIKQTKEKEKDQ